MFLHIFKNYMGNCCPFPKLQNTKHTHTHTLIVCVSAPTRFQSVTSGCSTAMWGYLGLTCDTTETDGVVAAIGGGRTASGRGTLVGADVWKFTFDTNGIALGKRYQLCVDLDGTDLLAFTDTGFGLFVGSASAESRYLDH